MIIYPECRYTDKRFCNEGTSIPAINWEGSCFFVVFYTPMALYTKVAGPFLLCLEGRRVRTTVTSLACSKEHERSSLTRMFPHTQLEGVQNISAGRASFKKRCLCQEFLLQDLINVTLAILDQFLHNVVAVLVVQH